MADASLITRMKVDLSISTTAYDERLGQYLDSAKAEIEREGYTFPSTLTVDDMEAIVMYAEEMWLSRASGLGTPGESMSRKLRYRLNNMIFHQKMREGSND